MNDAHKIESVAVIGTTATWALANISTFLSIAVSLCTLVVVGPKAWAIIKALFKPTLPPPTS